MKRIMLKYKLVMLLIAVFCLGSCKKFLVEEPVNSTFAEAYWKSAGDLRSALAGNYALVRNVMNSGNWNPSPRYFMYGDAIAKNYFTIQYVGDGLEGIQDGDFTFQYNLQYFADWTNFYKAITMSNIIINRTPKVADELLTDITNPTKFKNEVLGEAYFLRAFTYFMMLRVWGDVPLITEEYEDPISAPELPRSPKKEVMAQIEKDATTARELLPWQYAAQGNAKVTANKGAVNALLAHFYLWKATMSDVNSNQPVAEDVDKADKAIDEIIGSGMYSLTDTANYYRTFEGLSSEGIFEITMNENNREGTSQHIANMFLRTAQLSTVGTNSRCYVSQEYLSNHFYKIEDVWDWYWNATLNQWEWKAMPSRSFDDSDIRCRRNFTDLDSDRPTCVKYQKVFYRNAAQKLDPYISNNLIVFRLADMRLLKAEIALYRNQIPTAITIINEFRQRNGADESAFVDDASSKEEVMNEYILERGKELYLEGQIFYDLLRTRQYANFVPWLSESRFRQEGFYWPINPALFKNNNKLIQTSFWRGKV
ncbi:RagB/SusD family nutrient uptake outer membrane protein [Sphingobacterium thalpophilum]|uniref:RagB/SusD family nutrient uptake outer membrane protein n=1 Tax=Sphingobacterium thalpophilum TaxID=259 RepID=UPI003C718C6E